MIQQASDEGLLLPGLDGTNPLGFLAALGVLRVLSLKKHGVKLSWQSPGGTWRPALHGAGIQLLELGAELHAAIQSHDHSAWEIDKRLPFEARLLRQHARDAALSASSARRQVADTLAAFGSEFFEKDDGTFQKTDFCMLRSGDNAGQGLTAYAKRIIDTVERQQLQRAIESTWLCSDDQCALRLDPAEDRPYAMQWRNPSKIGALSEKGANCLALFGMICFPVIPLNGQPKTTAFRPTAQRQLSFTWPIWRHAIGLSTVCSLLTLPELQQLKPDREMLMSLGIDAVYRCDQVMTSKYYANFTPSQRV